MNAKVMLRITAPHFCAGIVRGGLCAPILRKHLRGKTLSEIREYCRKRGWKLEVMRFD